jgi:hypothetical protein
MRDESFQEVHVGAHQPIELRALGQGGEGISQPSLSVAVEIPLARETAPAGEEGQGNHLVLGKGGLWARPRFWRMGLAEVVCDNVECNEEGVHLEHEESVPFPSGSGGKPTLANGHLPLKSSPDNSHQAFKTEKPSPVSVGGEKGVQIDALVADAPNEPACPACPELGLVYESAGATWGVYEGEKLRFIVVEDVKGQTVTIIEETTPAGFKEFTAKSQKVLDSVKWRGS